VRAQAELARGVAARARAAVRGAQRGLRRAGLGGAGSCWRRVGGESGESDAAAWDDGGAAMSEVD